MNVIADFTTILEKEQEARLIPFLQTLDKAQKKELAPVLKKLYKIYSEYTQQPGSSQYRPKWSDPQRFILSVAAFVCHTQKDFEANNAYLLKKETFDEILPWYCPDWFSNFINNQVNNNFTPLFLTYDWYLEMVDQGYVTFNPALIAKTLPNYLFSFRTVLEQVYLPQNILIRKATLDEHIWYLFSYETTIQWADKHFNLPHVPAEGIWTHAFKKHSDEGTISRERLLKETLTAANKNFNQNLSGWFIALFIHLEPSKAELLNLQAELLQVLNSPHSKPVNTGIKYLKDISDDAAFNAGAFLDHAPVLLASESKTTVATTLMALEKIAKKQPDKRPIVAEITCQAFIHQDEGLQMRAAKLLQKYADPAWDELKATIATYQDALLFDARNLLAPFIEQTIDDEQAEDTTPTPSPEKTPLIPIAYPQTFDELVFLACQAFDQNETYHFDLLPAALLRFQNEITAANIGKLTPAFQRAYKVITSDFVSTMGYLDNMLATFFIDYGQLLVQFYPAMANPIKLIRETFVKKEDERIVQWSWYKNKIGGIKSWNVFTHSLGYKPHKHLLLNAFFLLERRISLPLLSTPTHEPCWVSPLTLVERLVQYQNAKTKPADMDFQVAVSRCSGEDHEAALTLANQRLTGEYRQLISFLLGGTYYPQENYQLKVVWLVAALTRNFPDLNAAWFTYSTLTDEHLTGNFKWRPLIEPYTYQQWDPKLRKNVDTQGKRNKILLEFGDKKKKTSVIKNLFAKIVPPKNQAASSVYEVTTINYKYISAEHNDVKRFIYLNPNHPEVWLAQVVSKGLESPDFSSENEKKLITYVLEALLSLNSKLGPMAHLLVASCMISSDKTVRAYAAELWIDGVSRQTIHSGQIGDIIGRHQQIELAPFKRFTDLILSNMLQVSKAHNQALEQLLNACIGQLADKPANGLKKLLDIYAEALSANRSVSIPDGVLTKLAVWEKVESLSKSIGKIRQLAGMER